MPGKKRGRPPKVKVTETASTEPVAKVKSDVADTKPQFSDDSIQFGMEGRESMYDDYNKIRESEPVTDELGMPVTPTDTPPEVENTESTTDEVTEQQETEKPSEEVTEVEEPKTETKEETKDERTVPYGALKEEREKRKERDTEINTLQSQVQQLIEDNKTLIEKVSVNNDEDYVDDSQKEVNELKKEVAELKKANEENRIHREEDTRRTNEHENKRQIDNVNKELSKEGHPVIDQYAQQVILAELNEMYAEDPDYATTQHNPQGWKKIWLKKYPEIAKRFQTKREEEVIAEKEALKKDANLAGTQTVPSDNGKKETTRAGNFQDYKKLREESNVF